MVASFHPRANIAQIILPLLKPLSSFQAPPLPNLSSLPGAMVMHFRHVTVVGSVPKAKFDAPYGQPHFVCQLITGEAIGCRLFSWMVPFFEITVGGSKPWCFADIFPP